MHCSTYLLFAVQVCAVVATVLLFLFTVKNKLLPTSEIVGVKCQTRHFTCVWMHAHTFDSAGRFRLCTSDVSPGVSSGSDRAVSVLLEGRYCLSCESLSVL